MKIIKRDGRQTNFNSNKIESAVLKAFMAIDGDVSEYAVEKAKNMKLFHVQKLHR